MSGIIAISSNYIDVERAELALEKLKHRGSKSVGVFSLGDVFLGARINDEWGQPYAFNNLVIVYNGALFNARKLKAMLIQAGYTFEGCSEQEIIVKLYCHLQEKCLDYIDGMFAFVIYDSDKKEFFGARDHMSAKPLYYYHLNDDFMVSSEIKSLLSYFDIHQIDIQGLSQIIALGPSKSPGNGIYPNVREFRGGEYFNYSNGRLKIEKYWEIEAFEHKDSLNDTIDHIGNLVMDSITSKIDTDKKLCTFLSGGLDSSIITIIAKQYYPDLHSFSIDYTDNDKFFKGNDFQLSRDNQYIDIVSNKFGINHTSMTINNDQLVGLLEKALTLKDYPGMVDIDSSLHWFASQVKNQGFDISLSGEGADEIFGGYPWYYKERFENNFPWIRNLDERQKLLSTKYQPLINVKQFVGGRIAESLAEVPLTGDETLEQKKHKQLMYLNLNWFMQNLVDRKDRMTMGAGLEVRMPFADYRIVQYLYNIPWDFKFCEQMEKGLLRQAVKNYVPDEIVFRKKNPYPKTHNPAYLDSVKKLLKSSLKNKNSVLHELFDKNVLKELLSDATTISTPWYGQLMNTPQLIAFLYQIDIWFEKYQLDIKL